MALTEFENGLSRILVAVRIRPLNKKELLHGPQMKSVARKVDDQSVLLNDPLTSILPTERGNGSVDLFKLNHARDKIFHFDKVFDEDTTQRQLYEGTALQRLVDAVIGGINSCVFAYGPTGTGKTHTMIGSREEPGMTTLLMTDLFKGMANLGSQAQAELIYLEIYNENIRDLLNPNPNAPFLDLRTDANHHVTAAGATTYKITSTEQVLELLSLGSTRRTTEATLANEVSSRSHAILQVVVSCKEIDDEGRTITRSGKLSMIDLAGSERAAATGNTGIRMIEGAAINRSLLALGNCINRLAGVEDDGAKVIKTGRKGKVAASFDLMNGNSSVNTTTSGGNYVNYRDSKLTRILSDSLGGNCRTVMIAACSPSALSFLETSNTLKYASRARNIQNYVMENVKIVEVGGVKRLAGDFDLLEYNKEAENQQGLAEVETEALRLNGKSAKLKAIKTQGRTYSKKEVKALIDMYEELLDQHTALPDFEMSVSKKRIQLHQWKQGHGLATSESTQGSRQIAPAIRLSESNPNLSKESTTQLTKRKILAGHHSRGVSLDLKRLMATTDTPPISNTDLGVSRERYATSPLPNMDAHDVAHALPQSPSLLPTKNDLQSSGEAGGCAQEIAVPSPLFGSAQNMAIPVVKLSDGANQEREDDKKLHVHYLQDHREGEGKEVTAVKSSRRVSFSVSESTNHPLMTTQILKDTTSSPGQVQKGRTNDKMIPPPPKDTKSRRTRIQSDTSHSRRQSGDRSHTAEKSQHQQLRQQPASSQEQQSRVRKTSEPIMRPGITREATSGVAHVLKRKLTLLTSSLLAKSKPGAVSEAGPTTIGRPPDDSALAERHYITTTAPDTVTSATTMPIIPAESNSDHHEIKLLSSQVKRYESPHQRNSPLIRGQSFPQTSTTGTVQQKDMGTLLSQARKKSNGVPLTVGSLTGPITTALNPPGSMRNKTVRKTEKADKLDRLQRSNAIPDTLALTGQASVSKMIRPRVGVPLSVSKLG